VHTRVVILHSYNDHYTTIVSVTTRSEKGGLRMTGETNWETKTGVGDCC